MHTLDKFSGFISILKAKTGVQFSFQLQQYLLFPVLFRPGNGTRAFCWTNEDREALAEVSIILAADGRGMTSEKPFPVTYNFLESI